MLYVFAFPAICFVASDVTEKAGVQFGLPEGRRSIERVEDAHVTLGLLMKTRDSSRLIMIRDSKYEIHGEWSSDRLTFIKQPSCRETILHPTHCRIIGTCATAFTSQELRCSRVDSHSNFHSVCVVTGLAVLRHVYYR